MSVVDALRFPQTFLLIAISFLTVTGNQSLIFFLPSITDNMKSMPVVIRTLAASLPYVCSALGILINGIWAQRTGESPMAYGTPDTGNRGFAIPDRAMSRPGLARDEPILFGGIHIAGVPACLLDLALHTPREVGCSDCCWTDLFGQSRRLRWTLALWLSKNYYRPVRHRSVGSVRVHAFGWRARYSNPHDLHFERGAAE